MAPSYNPARIATGVVLLAALGAALSLGGLFLLALVLFFSLLGQWEFYALFETDGRGLSGRLSAMALGAVLLCAAWHNSGLIVPVLGASFVILALMFLFSWAGDETTPFSRTALLAAGLLYIPLLLSPVFAMRPAEHIFLLCAAVFSDTAAYFAGSRWGRHKIWPRVSPAKSVEGSAAGLVACVASCTAVGAAFGTAPILHFVLLAAGLGVLAQLGDFFESALKRSAQVKDAGSILPGHGGVLDRADSMLFVIPGYVVCKTFLTFF